MAKVSITITASGDLYEIRQEITNRLGYLLRHSQDEINEGGEMEGPNVFLKYGGPEEESYDIQFDDNDNSNGCGFSLSYEEALSYISIHNGTDHGYFADYRGGTVEIVNNRTGETVYSEDIPRKGGAN